MSDWELRVSQRELHRLHVVRLTIEGRESVGRGAKLLGISARQMKRLRRRQLPSTGLVFAAVRQDGGLMIQNVIILVLPHWRLRSCGGAAVSSYVGGVDHAWRPAKVR
jgi:hypothetical protein